MKRIRLGNTVFEGLNNVYLFDGETTALVDTGVALPEVRTELEEGLAAAGLALADVDEVYLTHWHPDHAGLAGDVQAESDCEVFVHEADAPLVSGAEPSFLEDRDAQERVFESWGMPAEARESLQSFIGGTMDDLRGADAEVTPFADGDRFEVNGTELEAVHLPGHADGLTAFAFDAATVADEGGADVGPEESLLGDGMGEQAFVGDAILPRYTPNVGGADTRVAHPLQRYAESLVRVVERDWARVHPGHRDAIEAPSRRAAVILQHHRERTERVIDVLDEHGPCDTWTVSAHLFGDLDTIHILHGPGEAHAHLDHLEEAGVVEQDGIEYRLLDANPDVDSLFPETRFAGTVEVETEGH
ncbi:MBL fold metallo-hydrolase [Haloparvum sedimenti]|uniref:MBL fold metallo-hydrolase n=1 Tax=Haloparvum sedimenti TaxID=1678448 RepID=UPI00071E7DA1|nr:MBL fold metallo-hydrolase [Haloparvum sedimenti]